MLQLFKFKGGVKPPTNKTQSLGKPIAQAPIPSRLVVPLHQSIGGTPRPVVDRDGMLIMVDDERMPMKEGEKPRMETVRFRSLGCYPLSGAVESSASTVPEIIQEMLLTRQSERQGRVIDHDEAASMEKKKQEGYF